MKKVFKSMSYAFIAQIISLLVSVFASFFVSKFMTISGFGYYQLFLFYSTYVGLLQFGVSEGVYLECGGKRYQELNYVELKQLFMNALIAETAVLLVGIPVAQAFEDDSNRKVIIILLAIYAITYLFVTYFGLLLQAVNKTEQYSLAIIIGKLLTLILFVALVFFEKFEYIWFCLSFLLGFMISGVYVTVRCHEIVMEKIKLKPVLYANRERIVAGESLLLSGLVSSFIIGINRIYIDHFKGIEVFGKVSMSLSLINFFILFAIQIGMVMFPNVVILNDGEKARVYKELDNYSTLLMPLILIGYIPLRWILSQWIPQYTESIQWMLLFLPYMYYEIKTQVMYNTYMKALRKERQLFKANLYSFVVCAAVNYILIRTLGNLEIVFWIIDFVMIIKSISLSRIIEKEYGMNFLPKLFIESILGCLSSFVIYHTEKSSAILFMALTFILVYLFFNKRSAKA